MNSNKVINIFGEEISSIDNALNALLNILEKEIGKPLDTLNHEERTTAFRRLLEMGTFSLRLLLKRWLSVVRQSILR